jgi:uncharacterized protein
LRWTLIAIAVVQWSLVVTRGMLVWLAWDLTMVSSMLSSIVTVIGVATTMHWMLGYQQSMEILQFGGHTDANSLNERGLAKRALCESAILLSRPIAWACITDAIGFAALAFARVGPVQDYGCMMALASLVVLVGIFALIPCMALAPIPFGGLTTAFGLGYMLQRVPGDRWVQKLLNGWLTFAVSRVQTVVTVSTILLVVSFVGALSLRVETDFIKNFRDDSAISHDYHIVERELSGAGVWDIVLPAPMPLTSDYMNAVLELETSLREIVITGTDEMKLSQVLSFADIDRVAATSNLLASLPIETRLVGMKQTMGGFINTLVCDENRSSRYLRIMLRSREQSDADQKTELIDSVRQCVAQRVGGSDWKSLFPARRGEDCYVSGYYVLLSQLVSSVVADQWMCFAVAALGIWIAMTIGLASWQLSILAILPNVIPSLLILGYMGWSGTRINLGAAMIAAVSMGLSVDSSLHYLHRYNIERSHGLSVRKALSATQLETGMAVFLSTLALVVGFLSLSTSDFIPTVVFGTTAALTMIGGLIGNLILLPALVVLVDRRD